jgi:hypothetical protein
LGQPHGLDQIMSYFLSAEIDGVSVHHQKCLP